MFGKKKKKKDTNEINISSAEVRVVIKRMLGKVPVTIASFTATQQRDEVKNLVLVSAENDFKEDMNFTQQKIIDSMKTALEVSNISSEEKAKKLREKVENQNALIRSIKEGYAYVKTKNKVTGEEKKEKVKVNYIEEENRLKLYKLLEFHYKHYGEGSYEEIDNDGFRRITFKFQEGIFYPYYFCDDSTTIYADMTSKRKIYKQEQDLIDLDYLNENKHFLSGWKGIAVLAFCLLFLFGNMFYSYKLHNMYNQWDESNIADLIDKAEGSALNCAYYYATIGEETATFINSMNNNNKEVENNTTNKIDLR